MSGAEDLAARMRAADAAGEPSPVPGLLSEQIELHHVPPSPMDGLVDGSLLAAAMSNTDALPRRTIERITVAGDRVIMRSTTYAEGEDGVEVPSPHVAVYTVRDGMVIALDSHYEGPGLELG
jgi:ketosteroid isomerase-like protein